jgi:hypothetical protein
MAMLECGGCSVKRDRFSNNLGEVDMGSSSERASIEVFSTKAEYSQV